MPSISSLEPLKQRIRQFRDLKLDDDFVAAEFDLKDTSTFKLSSFRKRAAKDEDWNKKFIDILYRPFDCRKIYYSKDVVERPLFDVMRHMLQPNLALIAPRQFKEESGAMVTQLIAGHKTVSAFDINYIFPLFLYPDTDKRDLFSEHDTGERLANITPKLIETLEASYRTRLQPENIFNFVYAVLYSNPYRKKYAELLKTEFPRVPFTNNFKLFQKIAQKGAQLVDAHLLRLAVKPIAKCEGSGELRIARLSYDPKKERVYINPDKYFSGVPSDVWDYHIGGYQVCEKWLKDRKGRTLSSEEIASYAKVVTALAETITIQNSLDDLFKEVESNLLEVSL